MKFDLAVTVREKTGKGAARQLRREGKVPGVLYGQGECLLLTIEPDSLVKILKAQAGGAALVSLTLTGAKSKPNRTALLRDFQVDPVEGNVLHADLFEISMNKPIRVKVPLHLIGGMPAGVKEGGILHHNMRELHIECLPAVLPDFIEVDASGLAIAQGLHLKDVAAREGIRYLDDPEQMVVSVAAPMTEAKLESLLVSAAAGPEGAKEPEVATKGKVAGEAVEGGEAAKAGVAAADAKGGEKKAGTAVAADAKGGEKKGVAAPQAEKKEAEKEEVTLRLIVGLGNPGAVYAQTRHNVGMWVIERAAARWSIRLAKRGMAHRGSGRLGSELLELAGTLDWMNITGPPLKGLLREFSLTADDLILVHDDLDLDLGRLRIKQAGGHGGHNGIKSVIDTIGTAQFVRVKIGIGRPAPRQDSTDYVLQAFTREELRVLNPCLDRTVDALECLIHRGVAVAMNEFNVRENVGEEEEGSQADLMLAQARPTGKRGVSAPRGWAGENGGRPSLDARILGQPASPPQLVEGEKRMGLCCGMIGLPNVGKTTVFNALVGAGAVVANYPFSTVETNVGIAQVPDPRVDRLVEIFKSKKKTPSTLEVRDIAGLVEGASTGEGLGNQFLGQIREVDVLMHVVRCFQGGDVVHVSGSVNPIRDIGVIETELMLADLETLDRRKQRTEKKVRAGDKKAAFELAFVQKLMDLLDKGEWLGNLPYTPEERVILDECQLLSAKPVLFVANVTEGANADEAMVKTVREFAEKRGAWVVTICGQLEAELSTLPDSERADYLKEMGLTESGLVRLTREAYALLNLITFFTAGETESRAWPLRKGLTAPQAAGKIHSDMERGFIRAEVYTYDDLMVCGSEAKVKEKGLFRLEGKDYIIKEADIVYFRFNV